LTNKFAKKGGYASKTELGNDMSQCTLSGTESFFASALASRNGRDHQPGEKGENRASLDASSVWKENGSVLIEAKPFHAFPQP
jgi:hypothetical protein